MDPEVAIRAEGFLSMCVEESGLVLKVLGAGSWDGADQVGAVHVI